MATSTSSREPGRSGGRRVARHFSLVKGDGHWPDEIDTDDWLILDPPGFNQSWAWAVAFLDVNTSAWLKVPLTHDHGTTGWAQDKNSVRSTIWSTAKRTGIKLESCEWEGALWFRVR